MVNSAESIISVWWKKNVVKLTFFLKHQNVFSCTRQADEDVRRNFQAKGENEKKRILMSQ